jgi:hypothetical protein
MSQQLFSRESRNPFHFPGPVPPEKFIGHQKAIEFCRARFTAQRPTNIAITGERRVGKTSLLHYLQAFGSQEDWGQHLCLWLDLGLLSGALEPNTFWQTVLQLLIERLDSTSPLVAQIINLQSRSLLATEDIRRFLNIYKQCCPMQPIILLLDEFEQIFAAYNQVIQDLLNGLRALTLAPDFMLILITATRDPLSQVCQRFMQDTGLEFHSNFAFYSLERFDIDEMVQVVQKLLTGTNVEFTQQELYYIWEVSQGPSNGAQPLLVQAAASLIFDQKQGSRNLIDYSYLNRQFKKLTRLIGDISPTPPPLNTAAIRELLRAVFSDEELSFFCFDHFRPVYEQFASGMDHLSKIHLLIEYCDRYEEFDKLLALVKKINPRQFAKFYPLIKGP